MIGGPTQGMGQQNGDAHIGSTQMLEVEQWEFNPRKNAAASSPTPPAASKARSWAASAATAASRSSFPKTGYSTPPPVRHDADPEPLRRRRQGPRLHANPHRRGKGLGQDRPQFRRRHRASPSTSRPTAPTTPSARSPSSAPTTTNPPAAAEHDGQTETAEIQLDTVGAEAVQQTLDALGVNAEQVNAAAAGRHGRPHQRRVSPAHEPAAQHPSTGAAPGRARPTDRDPRSGSPPPSKPSHHHHQPTY